MVFSVWKVVPINMHVYLDTGCACFFPVINSTDPSGLANQYLWYDTWFNCWLICGIRCMVWVELLCCSEFILIVSYPYRVCILGKYFTLPSYKHILRWARYSVGNESYVFCIHGLQFGSTSDWVVVPVWDVVFNDTMLLGVDQYWLGCGNDLARVVSQRFGMHTIWNLTSICL